MDKTSSPSTFWHDALHSMHPSIRVRYYQWFSLAESWDRSFDAALDLWRNANRAAVQTWRTVLR